MKAVNRLEAGKASAGISAQYHGEGPDLHSELEPSTRLLQKCFCVHPDIALSAESTALVLRREVWVVLRIYLF